MWRLKVRSLSCVPRYDISVFVDLADPRSFKRPAEEAALCCVASTSGIDSLSFNLSAHPTEYWTSHGGVTCPFIASLWESMYYLDYLPDTRSLPGTACMWNGACEMNGMRLILVEYVRVARPFWHE